MQHRGSAPISLGRQLPYRPAANGDVGAKAEDRPMSFSWAKPAGPTAARRRTFRRLRRVTRRRLGRDRNNSLRVRCNAGSQTEILFFAGASSRAPKIAGLVPPVRLTFQFYPPSSPETNDVAHNTRLPVVTDGHDDVAEFEIRLRFHRACLPARVNVARPIKFPAAPHVNEMGGSENGSENGFAGRRRWSIILPKAKSYIMYLSRSKSNGRPTRNEALAAGPVEGEKIYEFANLLIYFNPP